MKIALALLLAMAAAGAVVVWQAPPPAPQTMAGYIPAGPALVLEASDFAALLRDWQGSKEKSAWLASDNYKVFSNSMLLLRLSQLRDEFAGAAALAPDMSLVESVAGTHSILALYNLREIEFVYITRLPTAKAVESVLWQKRNDYQPRQSGGVTYYVRSQGDRQVAFAASGDYLVLATREDLMGRALALMNSAQAAGVPAVTSDAWFQQAVAAAGPAGDLRLTLDLQTLARAPQFRSYWIQQNTPDLRAYRAAICDLRRTPSEIREERMMLRMESAAAPAALDSAIAGMIPSGAGLYRMWSAPSVDQVVAALRHKVLRPGPEFPSGSPGGTVAVAPQSNDDDADAATTDDDTDDSDAADADSDSPQDPPQVAAPSEDLETRIDEAPLPSGAATFDDKPLRQLLSASTPRAMLVAQTVRDIPGGILAATRAVVIVEADSWDAAVVREIFGASATIRGRFLIAGDAGTAQAAAALGDGVVYTARFAHAQERGGYIKMLRLMDQQPAWARTAENDARQPLFFAENLTSLSGALQRLSDMSIVVRDTGHALQQTVVYHIAP